MLSGCDRLEMEITISEKLDATTKEHLTQLAQEGWCVIENVIPEALSGLVPLDLSLFLY